MPQKNIAAEQNIYSPNVLGRGGAPDYAAFINSAPFPAPDNGALLSKRADGGNRNPFSGVAGLGGHEVYPSPTKVYKPDENGIGQTDESWSYPTMAQAANPENKALSVSTLSVAAKAIGGEKGAAPSNDGAASLWYANARQESMELRENRNNESRRTGDYLGLLSDNGQLVEDTEAVSKASMVPRYAAQGLPHLNDSGVEVAAPNWNLPTLKDVVTNTTVNNYVSGSEYNINSVTVAAVDG